MFSDAIGTWNIRESSRTGDSSLECDTVGTIEYNKEFTLSYPNIVEDEIGNFGTWTLVYNQGFEVRLGGKNKIFISFIIYVTFNQTLIFHLG